MAQEIEKEDKDSNLEEETCKFCKLVAGKLPCFKVVENTQIMAFAPTKETISARGHLLVIPKNHVKDIYEISLEDLVALLQGVKSVSKKLRASYDAEGINILHASGKAAQQSVFHFHIHLIPRYRNDNLDLWPHTGYRETNYPAIYKEMASLFRKI